MLSTLLSLAVLLLAQGQPPGAPTAPPPTAQLPAEQIHPRAEAAAKAELAPATPTPEGGAHAVPAEAGHGDALHGDVPTAGHGTTEHAFVKQAAGELAAGEHRAGHDAAAGEHEGAAHGGKHHDTSVSGVIFHHVSNEPCWYPILWDKQAGALVTGTGAAAMEACEAVADHEEAATSKYFSLSIGKLIVSMWVAAFLLVAILVYATSRRAMVPKGLYNFIESLVVFIRDEIAIKNIGEHGAHHYTPYLCTAFFFILFINLFGLIPIPGVGTPSGNLSVTVVLALFTFTLTQIAGMRAQGVVGYWMHLVPSGVPKWLYPIMVPVELLGLFTKPFALTIRLFANMLAGHIVIYFLIALTVLLTPFIAPVSVGFALGIYMLELFVAFVQAYVFTMLSALFIGMASHSH